MEVVSSINAIKDVTSRNQYYWIGPIIYASLAVLDHKCCNWTHTNISLQPQNRPYNSPSPLFLSTKNKFLSNLSIEFRHSKYEPRKKRWHKKEGEKNAYPIITIHKSWPLYSLLELQYFFYPSKHGFSLHFSHGTL